jgi:hypothetical protein
MYAPGQTWPTVFEYRNYAESVVKLKPRSKEIGIICVMTAIIIVDTLYFLHCHHLLLSPLLHHLLYSIVQKDVSIS